MRKKLLLTTVAAATMLFGSAITANAAQEDLFDAEYYAETYPDVVALYGNDAETLLQQYLGSGITEGRSANAYFNALAYKTANTDLAAAFGDDWDAYADHYIEYGVAEGRYTGGTRAITADEYAAAVAKMLGVEDSTAESLTAENDLAETSLTFPYELYTIYYDNLGHPYFYGLYDSDKTEAYIEKIQQYALENFSAGYQAARQTGNGQYSISTLGNAAIIQDKEWYYNESGELCATNSAAELEKINATPALKASTICYHYIAKIDGVSFGSSGDRGIDGGNYTQWAG